MATSNLENKLVVTDPDFETIKLNLKNFLRSQDTFTDYDFEGSGMSNLIDLLAYNTHYMAFYANMIANESFLDTASIRDSVVSHAKMLGYTPHSTRSARARINLKFSDTTTSTTLTLPKFTKFSSSAKDGVNYVFTNLAEKTAVKEGNSFTFHNLELTEGTPVNYVYTYNSLSNPQAEFIIQDAGVDTSTLEVTIQNSSTDLKRTVFFLSTDSTVVDEESLVYFLDETKGGKYKIYFGNGVLGKALSDGNIIIVSYLLSKGSAANKTTGFTMIDTIKNSIGTTITGSVTMVQAAAGGAESESLESIKFAAPKAYISNNRAVTKNDYIALIQKNYPYLEAVNVWGGEESDPPEYGKIFISAKPSLGYEITATERQYILENVIAPISVVTVTPEFVNPEYIYLNLDITVNYDQTATNKSPGEIESVVRTSLVNFSNTYLDKFNTPFKLSKLLKQIDNSEQSILSNEVKLKLEKRISPVLNSQRNYIIRFNSPIKHSFGRNRIYSFPSYSAFDSLDTLRDFYFEEVPLSYTGIYSVKVLYGGYRGQFSYAPTLKVTGDGYGAQVEAIITNGIVTAVKVIKGGSEYSTVKITAYDRDGKEVPSIAFEVFIDNRVGTLRTYYYDDNSIKQISSTNAGTINYVTGTIELTNFTPIDIDNDTKVLKFYAEPESSLLQSSKNAIITIDTEDTATVSIKAQQVQ